MPLENVCRQLCDGVLRRASQKRTYALLRLRHGSFRDRAVLRSSQYRLRESSTALGIRPMSADHHHVGARAQKPDRRGGVLEHTRHRMHADVVRYDDPTIAESITQQSLVETRGQGHRLGSVYLGQEDVAGHDHGYAGSDSRLERLELSCEQSIKILMKDRQLPMGILIGIAVAGEVLAACQHVLALHRRHERESRLSHLLARGAEGPRADHRVRRVAMDIEHRRKVQIDSERRQFPSHRVPDGCCLLRPA